MITLTVIIPVYNEQATILKVVRKVKNVPIDKEIIIVDDASTDDTPEILKTFEDDPDVTVLTHPENKGRGAGIRTALAHARGFITVFQDGDLELDPSHFPRLIEPILDGETDIVFGSRFLGKGFILGMGLHAYLANVFLAQLTDIIFKASLTDVLTMFQVAKTGVFRDLQISADRWNSTIEITAKILKKGLTIVELPVDYIPRTFKTGKKVKPKHFFSCLWTLLRFRYFHRDA